MVPKLELGNQRFSSVNTLHWFQHKKGDDTLCQDIIADESNVELTAFSYASALSSDLAILVVMTSSI